MTVLNINAYEWGYSEEMRVTNSSDAFKTVIYVLYGRHGSIGQVMLNLPNGYLMKIKTLERLHLKGVGYTMPLLDVEWHFGEHHVFN